MLRVLLQPIQRAISAILPSGGTQGQILVKKSDADNDAEWADAPEGTVVVDQSLDTNSTNAVSNQAVSECLVWHEIN